MPSFYHDDPGVRFLCTRRWRCEFGINREVAYLPLCFFVEAKKLSSTIMNKNISGVVVRGTVLIIIVYLLSMRVE